MRRGYPSMVALLGLLAILAYRNREKIPNCFDDADSMLLINFATSNQRHRC